MPQLRFRFIDLVLLVVFLATLGALIPPALNYAREGSRRSHCANNLRQISTGLDKFHDAQGTFPPAALQPNAGVLSMYKGYGGGQVPVSHANWLMLLLPYLGEEQLSSTFDTKLPISDSANAEGRTTTLSLANCPADTYNRPDNRYVCPMQDGSEVIYARGNYAINGGSGPDTNYPGSSSYPEPSGIVKETTGNAVAWWGTGVAGVNKSFSRQDFANKLTTLVAIEEIRAGIAEVDSRGAWALGQIGSSMTFAHGLYGDAVQPNNRFHKSDDIVGCNELREQVGQTRLEEERMGCAPDSVGQATARSMHPDGVNVLFLDGAVRFIPDNVDPHIWHMIHSRTTQEEIPIRSLTRAVEPIEQGRVFLPRPMEFTLASAQKSVPGEAPPEPITNSIGMQLRRIPAGEFMMALPDKDRPGSKESPEHLVRITKPFLMGVTEVTQRQFAEVMGKNPSWHAASGGGKAQVEGQATDEFPAEQMSWYDADAFCQKLSARPAEKAAGRTYRLPTEAQWEYVCRGGSPEPYVFETARAAGDESGENGGGPYHNKEPALPITKVGTYPPNPFGICDMRGSVWEWVADWYDRDYYRLSPRDDPPGPTSGAVRIVRGIDWVFTGNDCMLPSAQTAPELTNCFVGFRVVCDDGSTK